MLGNKKLETQNQHLTIVSKEESKKVNNKKDRLVAILGSREFTVSHNHMDQV